tara:strand:- start:16807 stop:17427 length:621 start_codon:yes stop_codon:yes gene_type:complete
VVIIDREYKLTEDNYINKEYKKKQIVIGNTFYNDMEHYRYWNSILNGKDKNTAAFTIKLDGSIHEHYNPKYYSKFININDYDKSIIPIVLENEGWLTKVFRDNKFINWSGDIYNRDEDVINLSWRSKKIWSPYSDEQINSLVYLCKELCTKFDIPLKVVDHNTKIDNIQRKKGIYYRSNYSITHLDVSPAFKFEEFTEKILKNGTN